MAATSYDLCYKCYNAYVNCNIKSNLEEKLVCLPLFHLELMRLLGEVEGEHLDGEGGVPDEEDDARGDDQDEDEDGVCEPLLLIGRADLIIDNHADPLPEAFQN